MKTTRKLAEIANGELFEVAGIKFIKFSEENGRVVAVAKDIAFASRFGDNNNFATSDIKKRLEAEILPKLESAVGSENIVAHEVDLLSLDGSDKWGKIECKISIPTFDFYRANVKIFDKYNPRKWYWLATPDSTSEHGSDYWVRCVGLSGFIDHNVSFCDNFVVRPFINFVSSISVISVSCEE